MNIIKSDIVSLHGASISMIGGRPENQDDMGYLDTPLGFLVVICDGMGGGPGGKTASYIVKHEIAETLCGCSPQTPRDHALKMAAARAHQALEEKMKENPALSGMGSTFVAVLLNSQSAVIAHSGDSRCYRLHGEKCLFRTHDHSLVAELVRKKVMTEEDARQSPQANVITRGLGSTNNHVPEIDEIPYRKGDRFVLCTDGIWGAMPHPKLLETFAQPSDIQRLISDISTIVDKIGFSKGGGHDNHTIAMFELEKDSLLKDSFSWRKWAIFSMVTVLVLALICLFLWLILGARGQKGISTSKSTVHETTDHPLPVNNQNRNYSSAKEVEGNDDNNGVQDYSKERGGQPDSKTDNKNVVNGNVTHNDDTLFQRLLQMSRRGKDSDSVSKQDSKGKEEKITRNPVETTQKIINRYESAKVVAKKTLAEEQKSLETIKTEIKALFVDLSEQTRKSISHQSVEAISRVVDNPVSWYVTKEPDKNTKLFVLTSKSKEYIDKQIIRLKELKKNLERE